MNSKIPSHAATHEIVELCRQKENLRRRIIKNVIEFAKQESEFLETYDLREFCGQLGVEDPGPNDFSCNAR